MRSKTLAWLGLFSSLAFCSAYVSAPLLRTAGLNLPSISKGALLESLQAAPLRPIPPPPPPPPAPGGGIEALAIRSVDVAITKSVSPTSVPPGSSVSFTITVKNQGSLQVRELVMTDTLPVGTSFLSCSSNTAGVCGGSGSQRTVSFATLGKGKVATIKLVASVDSTLAPGTELSNTARVTSTRDVDPDTSNNTATATATLLGTGPESIGRWIGPFPWPLLAIHQSVLTDGRVLVWGPSDQLPEVWDPASDTFTPLAATRNSLFCAGHSFLPDGRVLVAGGHLNQSQTGVGSPDINIFDPATNSWTEGPAMNAPRWYPSTTTLPNGEVLVLAGNMSNASHNLLPQIWQADNTWRDLTGATLDQATYPRIFVAPNGYVFYAGSSPMSKYLDTSGAGSWADVSRSIYGNRDYGTAVMFEPGKVLAIGGGGRSSTGPPPTATAEIIDLNTGGGWRSTSPMAFPRRQLNATILADGKVLVTGGTSQHGFNNGNGSVYAAEVWDPATEGWTTLASMTVRRGYHSTAVLLPDGRVVSAGGQASDVEIPNGDANHEDAEIFSPPYLFAPDGSPAVRPTISSAPSQVGYGQPFTVLTPDAGSIAKVNLIRLSSVTHAFNQSQRLNHLSFTPIVGGLLVTSPSGPTLAPPGPYLLFILDANGVPSVAKIILLG